MTDPTTYTDSNLARRQYEYMEVFEQNASKLSRLGKEGWYPACLESDGPWTETYSGLMVRVAVPSNPGGQP